MDENYDNFNSIEKMMRDYNECKDTITIISEPGALVFATRKKWKELPEKIMDELNRHEIINVFQGTTSTFLLLKNHNPLNYLSDPTDAYRLVRISMDEEGKQHFQVMSLAVLMEINPDALRLLSEMTKNRFNRFAGHNEERKEIRLA